MSPRTSVECARAGLMLFDTDVLIWVLRGSAKAAKVVDSADRRAISVVTYMELLQGARDKREIKAIKSFLVDMQFQTIPLTENIAIPAPWLCHRGTSG